MTEVSRSVILLTFKVIHSLFFTTFFRIMWLDDNIRDLWVFLVLLEFLKSVIPEKLQLDS